MVYIIYGWGKPEQCQFVSSYCTAENSQAASSSRAYCMAWEESSNLILYIASYITKPDVDISLNLQVTDALQF